MKLLIVTIILISMAFAGDRTQCFEDYRAGKIDKKMMMECANIKDTGYLPVPKGNVSEPLPINAKSTSTNFPAISSNTQTDPLANITAIKHIALIPVNTDGNADKDSLEVGIIFGDSHANQAVLPEGTVFSYKYNLYEYNVMTKQNGRLLLSSNGTITKNAISWASFLVKIPSLLKHDMYVSSEITLVFQNGKTLYGKDNTTFNLN